MLDDLKELIDTSDNKPKRSMVDDMDQLSSIMHDYADNYGYLSLKSFVTSWLRGRERTEA